MLCLINFTSATVVVLIITSGFRVGFATRVRLEEETYAESGHWEEVQLSQEGSDQPLGCESVRLLTNKSATRRPLGTLYVNDKSKGIGWLIAFQMQQARAVELSYETGNHEAAISPDKLKVAIPSYERARFGDTEGGGIPGYGVTLLDLHSGKVQVAPVSPVGDEQRPHGAAWTDSGELLVTYQLTNVIIKYRLGTEVVRKIDLGPTGCNTPHLVKIVPDSPLAVTGCRCTNPDKPSNCKSKLVVFDHVTGKAKALLAGAGAEGIAVTSAGDVWVGGLGESVVHVFGFKGQPRTLKNFKLIKSMKVPFPLRMAFDLPTNTVSVASLDLGGTLERAKLSGAGSSDGLEEPNLRVFDASSYKLIRSTTLVTSQRGLVNMEGLTTADGLLFAPGFDTQAMAIVDLTSLAVVAELYFPRCTLPKGFCKPKVMSDSESAKTQGIAGWNNWSGGYCPKTMRNHWDRRFTTLDGPEWSPVNPAWATAS